MTQGPESRRGLARLGRASGVVGVSTGVALAGHVAGGGAVPEALGLVVPIVLAMPVAVALAGRTLSLLRLAVTVTVSQALFHLLFVLGTSTGSPAAGHAHAGHGYASPSPGPVLAHDGALATLPDQVAVGAPGGSAMIAGHLLAAVATIALLHRGELLLAHLRVLAARLADWFVPRSPSVRPTHLLPSGPTWVPHDVTALPQQLARCLVRRRGPPVLAAA